MVRYLHIVTDLFALGMMFEMCPTSRYPDYPKPKEGAEMQEQVFKEIVDSILDTTPKDRSNDELHRGDLVGTTGGIVLECEKQRERVVGDTYASWKALCFLPQNNFTPFVVWTVIARPNGFVAESGEYRRNLPEALHAYL
jgi:hypothetical protein